MDEFVAGLCNSPRLSCPINRWQLTQYQIRENLRGPRLPNNIGPSGQTVMVSSRSPESHFVDTFELTGVCSGKQFLTHCAAKGLYVPRGASPFATAKQCWLEQLVDSPRNHFVVAKAFSKLLDQSEKSFYGIIKWVMQDLEKLLNKHESTLL